MTSKKVAYIIPLHKKSDLVFRAMDSIGDNGIVIVSIPESLEKWFNKGGKNYNSVVITNDKTSYPSLVNAGIKYVKESVPDVDYVSILEYDDVLTPNSSSIVNKYGSDWESIDILAPLACVVKYNDGDDKPILVGITNEAAMAPQLAEEFGVFDFNMMLRTNFIFVNGCYIKPKVFEDYGVFKENFEMFYDYEWTLRMVYNGVSIKTVPMATHFHALTEDGAFESHRKVSKDIVDKWLGAARREYFFDEDRAIKI